MKTRQIRTKFNCRINVLLEDYFSNEELIKQMPFKKFSLVSLTQSQSKTGKNVKVITRRFLLNISETKIPEVFKPYITNKKIEWEETISFDYETQTGMFDISLVGFPQLNNRFICNGEVVFAPFDNDKTERIMRVNIDINAPFLIKNLLETFVMDEIWLMIHHEAEVVNDDLNVTKG